MRYCIGVAVVLAIAACAKKESPPADTAQMGAAATTSEATKLGETDSLKTPESVRYDPDLDVFFISNINGNPSEKDGNGFIVVVPADSPSVVRELARGGKNGVTLNAPKGLAIIGDTLWVADIDAVRAFNRKTGAPVATVDLRDHKATFLNDVAVGPDGAIYVTDTGIMFDAKGNMTHPGTDHIFKITGRTVTEAATGDSLDAPNGITWDASNSRWLLAPFSGKSVQTWKEGDASPATFATGAGQYDGIEVLSDGRILVSSWADSAVHVVRGGTMTTLVSNVSAPADIGIDTKRDVLAVPRFNDNKVEYFRIP